MAKKQLTAKWDKSYECTYNLKGYKGIIQYSPGIAQYQGFEGKPFFAFIYSVRGSGEWFERPEEAEVYLNRVAERLYEAEGN